MINTICVAATYLHSAYEVLSNTTPNYQRIPFTPVPRNSWNERNALGSNLATSSIKQSRVDSVQINLSARSLFEGNIKKPQFSPSLLIIRKFNLIIN